MTKAVPLKDLLGLLQRRYMLNAAIPPFGILAAAAFITIQEFLAALIIPPFSVFGTQFLAFLAIWCLLMALMIGCYFTNDRYKRAYADTLAFRAGLTQEQQEAEARKIRESLMAWGWLGLGDLHPRIIKLRLDVVFGGYAYIAVALAAMVFTYDALTNGPSWATAIAAAIVALVEWAWYQSHLRSREDLINKLSRPGETLVL